MFHGINASEVSMDEQKIDQLAGTVTEVNSLEFVRESLAENKARITGDKRHITTALQCC